MASSLFVDNVHVCFESVLAMDNAGMVAMFESLVDTGLKGFLGCPAVIHEAALLEFFANGSVRDGMVVSTVNGVTMEISEQLFAETFELLVEGLTDLLEIPKDLVFDVRSIVSLSGEPVSLSGKKKEMAIEFRLLCDILAKTISVKAGSFDAITQEKFLMMAAITCGVRINWNRLLFNIFKDMVTPGSRKAKGYAIQISLLLENVSNLELGESSEFPSSKILTEKTVHRYIVLNDKVGMEVVSTEPRVKKTPTKRAAKRPAKDAAVAPVAKKKRTTKSTTGSEKETPETFPVEAKRKRRLILGSDDEIVDSEPVVGGITVGEAIVESVGISEAETAVDSVNVETVVVEPVSLPAAADVINKGISTTDDVDIIIEQVLAETAQIDTVVGDQDVVTSEVEDKTVGTADEFELWFNLSSEEIQARLAADRPIETASDTDKEFIVDQVFGTGVEIMETEDVDQSAEEAMSLEDILMTIPVDCPLPSAGVEVTKIILGKTISIPGVNEGDWYKASLPKIPSAEKGKAPLLERDPVKGNPIKEQFSLILADIEVLVMLREKIIDEVDRFFNSFSLKRLATLKIDESYFDKETLILSWDETDSMRVALNRRTYILTKYRELLIRKFLEARKINFTPSEVDIRSFVSTIALDITVLRDVQIATSSSSVAPSVQMMIDWSPFSSSTSDDSSMHFDDHDTADTSISLPPAATDVMESLAKLRASVDQIQSEQFRRSNDAHNLRDILLVHLRDLEKRISARFDEQDILSTQVAAAAFDTVDVRRVVKELDAKVTILDGQVSEIRSDQLDFRSKLEENYLNLSTQLGLIVDYLRSGDAKKGESGSSRPQPPPDNQSRPSGGTGGSGARDSGNKGGSRSRGDRSGSSKKRYSSSSGGPFRRSFEDWLG
ncbi:hypothetical protein F511_24331 [Dorcoceras hygrometricum]|uniref:Dystroglycan-like n=1 Tax=Dorcoceras hygrometricum TaxID=472368 RepID=A0A2Z7AQT3_9LAMI|nr:hypothetical protein F511_24331 [Dorcoceras hygrometricum]